MAREPMPYPMPQSCSGNLWPEHLATRWLSADGCTHFDLSTAFEEWAGIDADGSGRVSIGEEVGRLLVSTLAHQTGVENRWTSVVADMGGDERFAELVMKIADSAGLFDVQHTIYSAALSESGLVWANLFTLDAHARRQSTSNVGRA